VHEGDIGRIISGEATYVTGSYASQWLENLKANPEDSSLRLRAWIVSRALSGDIITEQNIHAIDVWIGYWTSIPSRPSARAVSLPATWATAGITSRSIFWFADDVGHHLLLQTVRHGCR